ncbi:recombinase family protein [Clostridium sp. LQ25]|nr:recombinase family protein [Clostridium sp. LQ25]
MTVYGYARCSTNETRQDISRQERELLKLGVTDKKNIYKEYESGTKTDRIELSKLLSIVQEGDTIIATEPSRITRSILQLSEIIELAKEKHLKLILGSFVFDCTSSEINAIIEGMLKTMGVFSELERNLISERVKSGMRNAKAKGKKIGRPATDTDSIPAIFYKHYPKYANGKINKKEFSRLCNLSYPTIYKYLKLIETIKK